MPINDFEDLTIWQDARSFSITIFGLTSIEKFNRDFTLIRQIRASSGSVMDNIAEGFERGGNREFIHFLSIAKGSLGETRSQLIRAHDCGYLSEQDLSTLIEKNKLLSKKIGAFIKYLKKNPAKGYKFP